MKLTNTTPPREFTARRGKTNLFTIFWSGFVLTAVLILIVLPFARGQSYLGTINGAVRDSTGAAVVGAHVQATDEITKFVSVTVTNQQGLYSIQFLKPGTYDVKVNASGFAEDIQTGVVLIPSDIKEVDLRVAPAATSQQVTVTANQDLLQTESATIGTDFTPNVLHNTPLLGDNLYMLATRVAGVYSNYTQNTESSSWTAAGGGVSGTTFNGVAGNQLVTVNGVDVLPPEGGPGQYTGYIPPAIAVQSLDIQTTPFDASFGHTQGAVENSVLKTGTQQLHAEVSMTYGDPRFDANTSNFSAQHIPRTDLIWAQPRFIVTGPVMFPKIYHPAHPKTFFVASWEHQQYRTSNAGTFSGDVPTVKEQAGDFSELTSFYNPGNSPSNIEGLIFDPTTTVPIGSTGGYAAWCSPNCVPGERESFRQEYSEVSNPLADGSTNYIPTNRLNPVGVNLLKYWPQPTGSGTSAGPYEGNYAPTTAYPTANWIWMGAFSIDHEFNDNNKLTVSYLPYTWGQSIPNNGFPYVGKYTGGPGTPQLWRKEQGGLIDYTRTISPTMVLDARTGGFYHNGLVEKKAGDLEPLADLGMTGATTSFPRGGFPGVSLTGPSGGYTGLTSQASTYEYSAIWDSSVIVSKAFQRHMVKTGFEYMLSRTDPTNPVSNLGSFSFDNTFTDSNPNNPNSYVTNGGDGLAALLLGYPTSGTASIVVSPAYEYPYWGAYVQDDWRITPKLTLNLGLRYDYAAPFTERHNQLDAGFNFSSQNPFNLPNSTGTGIASSNVPPASAAVPQGYPGGLYFVNTPQWPSRQAYRQEWSDRWQPRIGASYHILNNTVLRGGYATFFSPNYAGTDNTGFASSTSLVASTNGNLTPATCTATQGADAYGFCNMTNPYPNGFVSPTRTLLGLSTGLGGNVAFAGPSWLPEKDVIWSGGIQQQLPLNMMLDVEYHGNKVTGTGISKNWNALPNCYYYGGSCPNAGNYSALVTATAANPMAGYMPATSGLNAAKVPQQDLYLPYPEFGSVTQSMTVIDGTNQRLGILLDNALYVTLNKRISHGVEGSIAATYQHAEQTNTLLNAGDNPQDAIKFDNTMPDKFLVADIVYDTPKFNVNHLLGYVINDWLWSQSLNWQAGVSYGVPGSTFTTGVSPVTHHQSLAHWFNTCYIPVVNNGNVGQTLAAGDPVNTSPVYGTPTNCQYGEQPAWIQQPTQTLNQENGNPMRNVRFLQVPYYDMAWSKSFPIRESLAFTFRTEAHNVFNIPLLGASAYDTLTSSNFGVNIPSTTINGKPVYPQENDPRIIRFEGRLSF